MVAICYEMYILEQNYRKKYSQEAPSILGTVSLELNSVYICHRIPKWNFKNLQVDMFKHRCQPITKMFVFQYNCPQDKNAKKS